MNIPEPFLIDSINTTMFLELSEDQRFLDIEYFSAGMDQLEFQEIAFSGQVYNDSRLLELNAFNLTTPLSELTVSGQINGINLDQGRLVEQLYSAQYDLDINSGNFVFAEFSNLHGDIPDIQESLDFSIAAAGNIDSLQLDHFDVGIREVTSALVVSLISWMSLSI
ncbi:MAG: hypothetical protein U5K69_17545 [Balneolaceae bacterium]|nr:hypothetical protein [Balneolaceae bacterium]